MRRYDDPVEVRRGLAPGPGGDMEAPEQFLWRGRLWKVCEVLGHWVETGPWWQSARVAAVLGAEADGGARSSVHDLVAEREVWRVEAARRPAPSGGAGSGVFDLVLDWANGGWRLSRCAD